MPEDMTSLSMTLPMRMQHSNIIAFTKLVVIVVSLSLIASSSFVLAAETSPLGESDTLPEVERELVPTSTDEDEETVTAESAPPVDPIDDATRTNSPLDKSVVTASTPSTSKNNISESAADESTDSTNGPIDTVDAVDAGMTSSSSMDYTEATSTATSSEVQIPSNSVGTITAITTGDAVATANVLNVVNTSAINSTGAVVLANITNDHADTIDLRTAVAGTGTCALASCNTDLTTISLENNADISNVLFLEAGSGTNHLETNGGHGQITTGNAIVGLNLVTIANTTFIDSHYLIVTLNAFGDVSGDIVFPGLQGYFNTAESTALTATNLDNIASVETSINASAQSGNNTSDATRGTTQSGDTLNMTSIINSINASLTGTDKISVLLKVHGSWLGEITGLIPGITITDNGSGYYQLTSDGPHGSILNDGVINASNTATIINQATLTADSGSNTVSGSDSSEISTGRALVGANVVNIANATVIGRNWTMAIINIFGDFTGNLAFGRPDLWIGESVVVPQPVKNGSALTYSYLIKNQGDAPATSITVHDEYAAAYLSITDSSHPYTIGEDGILEWEVGALQVGETINITYQAEIKSTSPGTEITNTVRVTSKEKDNNVADNTDTATVVTDTPARRGSATRINNDRTSSAPTVASTASEQLLKTIMVVRSTIGTTLTETEGTVPQTLIIRNPHAAALNNISVHDILVGPNGSTLQTEIFDLGTLLPYEEVILEYDITFLKNASLGTYVLNTELRQESGEFKIFAENGTIVYAYPLSIISLLPEEALLLFPAGSSKPKPEVLGTSTSRDSKILTIEEPPKPTLLDLPIAEAALDGAAEQTAPTSTHTPLPYMLLVLTTLSAFTIRRYWTK